MSCREICRRTFRGCLRIPGCKTMCYKCILLPCCSSDSDDEKDEKDDEGYDSYGITASQNHLPEPQAAAPVGTNSVHDVDFENHDYINEPPVNQPTSSHVDNKFAEVMYVSMNLSENDENPDSKSSVQYTVFQDKHACVNNRHDYVNESVLFAKSDSSPSNCQTATNCVTPPIQRPKTSQVTDSSPTVKDYEKRESKVADTTSHKQTLILLETDL